LCVISVWAQAVNLTLKFQNKETHKHRKHVRHFVASFISSPQNDSTSEREPVMIPLLTVHTVCLIFGSLNFETPFSDMFRKIDHQFIIYITKGLYDLYVPIWAGHARFWLSAMAPSSRLLEDFEAQRGYDEHVEEPLETNKVRFFGMMGSSVACTQASRIVAAHDSTSPEKN
jgi:hypothetical protein